MPHCICEVSRSAARFCPGFCLWQVPHSAVLVGLPHFSRGDFLFAFFAHISHSYCHYAECLSILHLAAIHQLFRGLHLLFLSLCT